MLMAVVCTNFNHLAPFDGQNLLSEKTPNFYCSIYSSLQNIHYFIWIKQTYPELEKSSSSSGLKNISVSNYKIYLKEI